MKGFPLLASWTLVLVCGACGNKKGAAPPPVEKETAADEVLRISHVWRANLPERGILSPPSPVSTFETIERSELELTPEGGRETLVLEEHVELRSGESLDCSTQLQHAVDVRFGRSQGEAAVEITRPAISASRNCTGIHPEGPLEQQAKRALFVLRADQLVAIEPPLEKRRYLPASL